MSNASGFQLPLFEEVVDQKTETNHEGLENVVWSHSRRSTLEQCTRKYYYEYYGSNKKAAKGEPNKNELHFLKQLQNRYERTGSILHLVIGQYLKKAQKGDIWTLARLESWATDIFLKDIAYSKAKHEPDEDPINSYPPTFLQEFYYSVGNAHGLCQESLELMLQALRSFYNDTAFDHYRRNGINDNSLIEYPLKIKTLPCKVDGRLDLAFRDNLIYTIVDWKSGESDGGGDDSLQLAVYALWAIEHYSCSPDTVRIYKAYLRGSNIVEFDIDDQILNVARARIIQDAERMAYMRSYGEAALADAFSPCGHKSVCLLCPYRNICSDGRNFSND